jgi:hypothetical protein
MAADEELPAFGRAAQKAEAKGSASISAHTPQAQGRQPPNPPRAESLLTLTQQRSNPRPDNTTTTACRKHYYKPARADAIWRWLIVCAVPRRACG